MPSNGHFLLGQRIWSRNNPGFREYKVRKVIGIKGVGVIFQKSVLPMMLIILILATSSCSQQALPVQNGLLMPSTGEYTKGYGVYLPNDGFSIYDGPDGNKIGVLTRIVEQNPEDQDQCKMFFIDDSTKTSKQIDLSNYQEVSYEVWVLKYFERKDGFVRIVNKSENFWVSEHEISQKGFKVTEWQKFLIESPLLYYAIDPGLDLREAPTMKAKIIKGFAGDLFEIVPTKQTSGTWTRVKVKKYKEIICGSSIPQAEIVEYELEGWVELVDDQGRPNVRYFPRGC